jgi:hypothetical protein
MEYTGQNKLELIVDNAQIMKKKFTWQGDIVKRLASLLYAREGKTVDCEAIRRCHDLIKQNTGVFSVFRGNMALCVAALLSLSPNPQEVFSATLKVYGLLKGVKLHDSDFLVAAAFHIAEQSDASDYVNVVNRTRSFYDKMKAYHFFLTGQDDYIFAAMLGLADLDVASGVERIERIHSRLKGEFRDKNSVQALSQVLALADSDDRVITRVLALRDALRSQKIKLDQTYTLPILGVLAILPVDIGTIVRDIGAARDALKAKKGFGPLSVSTQELLLCAASIIASDYAESVKNGVLTATLATSISNMVIAQQTAMIAIISASTAASQSESS